MKQFFFFIILGSSMLGCKSPNREIVDSFEKVNKSLEHSNDVTSQTFNELYHSIKSKTEPTGKYSLMADTIYRVANDALDYLLRLRNVHVNRAYQRESM